ncbi:hypothetical protein AB1L88_09420 [Tautonia sp. JC769]|uniref:hypothetical protein n=1 Tax=Tautonia sp. JC769 TaxID=3232135 RepID=UPI0034575AEF
MVILVALLATILAYATDYHRLSRRGMREAADYGMEGFLYVPVAEAAATEDLSHHFVLMVFYAPANRIDRVVFGGPVPLRGVLWRLSG